MKATEYYEQGFSCSESIVMEAIDEGICTKELLSVATSFSGGMGSGCLCGALAGCQIVIGSMYGKNNRFSNPADARIYAKKLIEKFKEKYPATCCRVLSGKFDNPVDKRKNCIQLVEYCSGILKELIQYDRV